MALTDLANALTTWHTEEVNNPRRRPFRSRCLLLVADQELVATTRDISASGLGVNIPVKEGDIVPLTPAMRVTACFSLGDAAPLNLLCEVAWVSDKGLDVRGEPSVTIGLRFLESVAEVDSFVAHFRHNIIALSSNISNLHFIRAAAEEDYRVLAYVRADEAMSALYERAVSVLVIDTSQSEPSLLKRVRSAASNLPFAHFALLLITDEVNPSQFESLLELGRVLLYLRKPLQMMDLRHTLRLSVEAYVMRNENERLNAELERANSRLLAENSDLRKRIANSPTK